MLDADDALDTRCLEIMTPTLIQNVNVSLVYSDTVCFNEK